MKPPRQFYRAAGDRGARPAARAAGAARAHDPFRAAACRESHAPRCRSWCVRLTSCSAISRTPFPPTPSSRRGRGFIAMAKAVEFGATGLWTRINALNSPWALDDITEMCRRDRRQARRHHAAQGRGRVGHPLSRPAAGAARGQACRQEADPDPRHPGNRAGRQQRGGDRRGLAAHARHQPGTRRPCRLARHEDDAGRRRPSGLSTVPWPIGKRHGDGARANVPAGSLALHHREDGGRLRRRRHQAVLRTVRRLLRSAPAARRSSATPS